MITEQIGGFGSPAEYERLERMLEAAVADGVVVGVLLNPDYQRGRISGGRWFRDVSSGEVWRLVPPDFPFRGSWEPVPITLPRHETPAHCFCQRRRL
jgi:hypothetical protein